FIDSQKFNELSGKKLVAIAPGTVWETKRLPEKYFADIINNIPDEYTVVIIGGNSDSELSSRIVEMSDKDVINFAGKLSLPESIYLISLCKLLISNDSAPTHMAMAAGTPAFTIYTSTIPEFGFYPYLHNSKYFSFSDLDCKPCGIHGHKKCPTGTFDCAHKLPFGKIIEEINNFLLHDN
ncbi:MAG: glycosyltransferase family 9 protein, partial [Ignavibacteria bacterium]